MDEGLSFLFVNWMEVKGLDGGSNILVVGGGSVFNWLLKDEVNKSWIVQGASRYLTVITYHLGDN